MSRRSFPVKQMTAQVLESLVAEQENRNKHQDWEQRERDAVYRAALEVAATHSISPPTMDDVIRAENLAVGHWDYSQKFALRVVLAMVEAAT